MAFDFEGLAKQKTVSAKGDVADRLPSGLKPVTEEKKDDTSIIPDYFTNIGVGKSLLTVGEAIFDTAKQTNAYKKYMYSRRYSVHNRFRHIPRSSWPVSVLLSLP